MRLSIRIPSVGEMSKIEYLAMGLFPPTMGTGATSSTKIPMRTQLLMPMWTGDMFNSKMTLTRMSHSTLGAEAMSMKLEVPQTPQALDCRIIW
jgi:hypothetical protein